MEKDSENLTKKQIEKTRKAGQIVKQIKEEIKNWIKPKMPLLEIAEKIESRIMELGGKPAFPVNLGINENAAHYTPSYNDETLANGLLKVDFGVHINGYAADNSITFDLENSDENKKLIKVSEEALKQAIETFKKNPVLNKIGASVQKTAEANKLSAIQNLSGHNIEQWELHSGITIPNYDNANELELEEGVYAIEPFITKGEGKVYEGKPSGIYQVQRSGNVRDSKSREILEYISENYRTLPFCSRWLVKKFGTRALISLKMIEDANITHQFPQLIEKSREKVAQAEHTIIFHEGKVEIVT